MDKVGELFVQLDPFLIVAVYCFQILLHRLEKQNLRLNGERKMAIAFVLLHEILVLNGMQEYLTPLLLLIEVLQRYTILRKHLKVYIIPQKLRLFLILTLLYLVLYSTEPLNTSF